MAKKRSAALSLLLTVWMTFLPLSHAQTRRPEAQDQGGSQPAPASSNAELTLLLDRIWRVTGAPSEPPAGSIYIFLSNGTLLEGSCVETYRVATWTADKSAPRILHVVEDKRLAFTAAISELTPSTMRMQQRFPRRQERRNLTLTAVTGEFVCPDMPK